MEATEKQFRKRAAILSCLRQTKTHPSAEALYELVHREHPDISLATVYRNLTLFKNQGLIASLGTVNGLERFDGDTTPHVHFVCSQCSSVLDLPRSDHPIAACGEAAKEMGCQIDSYQLLFSGVCPGCLEKHGNNV